MRDGASHALEIRLLGPQVVVVDGTLVDVSGTKRPALLAMLALRRGRTVPVDALIRGLWDDDDLPADPRNAIHHHVARLRGTLGRTSISATADGYALSGTAAVDVLRFERLLQDGRSSLRQGHLDAAADAIDEALALWHGPALEGSPTTPWFSAEARRLEALRVDALEEKFEVALALGEHRELVSSIRLGLEEAPYRERLWGQLMLALYRSGRQADALDTFQEARRVLADQLGLEPGAELRQLQEAILAQAPAIASIAPASPRGNLPAPTTSFVDREAAFAQVLELLRESRLVTVCGPPGVGKSRLALEVGRAFGHEINGGVWRVDLARAEGPDDVARLLAAAFSSGGPDPLASVVARLRHSDALILLDGCERSWQEARHVAEVLLAECAGLRVLAASREPVRLPGEVRVQVEPLPLAAPATDPSVAPSVQLFVARAQAARPGFELDRSTAPLVADIVRRLDGLPLAIELAAARVSSLGLAELDDLVARRLSLLDDDVLDDRERAGLQRLVEWSYDLLPDEERVLLQALAVHRGGASLQSLAQIAQQRGLGVSAVPLLLAGLVDKSVVSVSFSGEVARYDVLHTVRDYVAAVLRQSGRLATTRAAHADAFGSLAVAARDELRGPVWRAWTHRLSLENDNLWAALAYAEQGSATEAVARLGDLGWYFAIGERVSEGRRFVERVLAAAPAAALRRGQRLELTALLCFFATEELDLPAAIEVAESTLAEADDETPWQIGLVQATLAHALVCAGDGGRGATMAAAAWGAVSRGGDHWSIAGCALLRAMIAAVDDDAALVGAMTDAAQRQLDEISFDAFRPPLRLLEGWLAERRRDLAEAAATYRDTVDLASQVGLADHSAFALTRLGSLVGADGDLERARAILRDARDRAGSAGASLAAAQADVEMARVLIDDGDEDAAERLLRRVVAWSRAGRRHYARESLFIALAGHPEQGALLELAGIADGRGDGAAGVQLRREASSLPWFGGAAEAVALVRP